MASLSIIDKHQNNSHMHHFVVQTRSFQIEKARDVDMYENLRVYIKRQNEKKKQEMEMSEELKRARREKELKHKRDKSTLSEVKEEINKSKSRLEELKNEKHRLFTEFKKVLKEEDELRKSFQRAKEAEALKSLNITFGPVTTTSPSASTLNTHPRLYQAAHGSSSNSGPIMPNSPHSNSTILPSSLHHLNPIQPMFYSQQHHGPPVSTVTSANSPNVSNASSLVASREQQQSRAEQSAINHHRLNGRVPTPPRTTFASALSQARQQPQIISQRQQEPPPSQPPVSIYSNNKPLQLHPQAPLSLTSMSSSVSSAPSMIPSSGAPSYSSDRHRPMTSTYKRTHEQASSSSSSSQSGAGVISGSGASDRGGSQVPSHHPHTFMHHSNFKHAMGQHPQQQHQHQHHAQHSQHSQQGMHQLPPGAFGQLGSHNLEHLQNLPTLPLYQSLLTQAYGVPSNASTLAYLNSMERK